MPKNLERVSVELSEIRVDADSGISRRLQPQVKAVESPGFISGSLARLTREDLELISAIPESERSDLWKEVVAPPFVKSFEEAITQQSRYQEHADRGRQIYGQNPELVDASSRAKSVLTTTLNPSLEEIRRARADLKKFLLETPNLDNALAALEQEAVHRINKTSIPTRVFRTYQAWRSAEILASSDQAKLREKLNVPNTQNIILGNNLPGKLELLKKINPLANAVLKHQELALVFLRRLGIQSKGLRSETDEDIQKQLQEHLACETEQRNGEPAKILPDNEVLAPENITFEINDILEQARRKGVNLEYSQHKYQVELLIALGVEQPKADMANGEMRYKLSSSSPIRLRLLARHLRQAFETAFKANLQKIDQDLDYSYPTFFQAHQLVQSESILLVVDQYVNSIIVQVHSDQKA